MQDIIINYILEKKLIDESTLKKALSESTIAHQGLLRYLIQSQTIDSDELAHIISNVTHFPLTHLDGMNLSTLPIHILPMSLIENHFVLPIAQDNSKIEIAMFDPTDNQLIETINFHIENRLQILIAPFHELRKIIEKVKASQLSINNTHISIKNTDLTENALITFVNKLIESAIQTQASDIHIEPYEQRSRIRFRKDGLLYENQAIDKQLMPQIATRIKIMSNLDIANARIPQDGRCQFKTSNGKRIDLRISTCPTIWGEKIVLRLLQTENITRKIDQLNFTKEQFQHFLQAIQKPQGLILVTGPTGSGKTVSLYAALQYLNNVQRNIVTIEDPVEIQVEGLNQVNVNVKAGLHFNTMLKSFLRQDPDVIMLGEIRDPETAETAIKAAQTGHLVLATLHTNSALAAIKRLCYMGIAPYNLSDSLILITAQRLVRKLCDKCKKPQALLDTDRLRYGFSTEDIIYQPQNCKNCHQGYHGRIAIHEILSINENTFEYFFNDEKPSIIKKIRQQKTFLSLQEIALNKVKEGITSLKEIFRIINFNEKLNNS